MYILCGHFVLICIATTRVYMKRQQRLAVVYESTYRYNLIIAIYNRVWEVTFFSAKFNLKHDVQRSVS
jgi:hypothetical protein